MSDQVGGVDFAEDDAQPADFILDPAPPFVLTYSGVHSLLRCLRIAEELSQSFRHATLETSSKFTLDVVLVLTFKFRSTP